MYHIQLLSRFILFILSNLGYWEFLRKKTKINIYFFPGLMVALQISILYLAGVLNVLFETSVLLYLGGTIFLIYNLCRNEKSLKFLRNYIRPGYIFLALSLAGLAFYLNGKNFTEYPLGSSIYIYFFATFIGQSESLQMLALAYMILVCLVPIFIYCKNNKIISFIFIIFITNFILLYNIPVTDLMVDTLLPIVSMNSLLYFYIYRNEAKECNLSKLNLFLGIPFLIQILQIKNSGVFFCMLASILILSSIKKDKLIFSCITTVLSPSLTLILWNKHCDYVFDSAATSKHAMTTEYYKTLVNTKTMEEFANVFSYHTYSPQREWIEDIKNKYKIPPNDSYYIRADMKALSNTYTILQDMSLNRMKSCQL